MLRKRVTKIFEGVDLPLEALTLKGTADAVALVGRQYDGQIQFYSANASETRNWYTSQEVVESDDVCMNC